MASEPNSPWIPDKNNVSIPLISEIEIKASLPLLDVVELVTIPTTSPTWYPWPLSTIVGFTVICPLSLLTVPTFNFRPKPCPVTEYVSTSASVS